MKLDVYYRPNNRSIAYCRNNHFTLSDKRKPIADHNHQNITIGLPKTCLSSHHTCNDN